MTYDNLQYRRAAIRWLVMSDFEAQHFERAEWVLASAAASGVFSRDEQKRAVANLRRREAPYGVEELTWESPSASVVHPRVPEILKRIQCDALRSLESGVSALAPAEVLGEVREMWRVLGLPSDGGNAVIV